MGRDRRQLGIRLDDEEWEALEEITERGVVTATAWVRTMIRLAAGLPLEVEGLNRSERRRVREIVRQWLASREAAEAGPRRRREVARALGKLGGNDDKH